MALILADAHVHVFSPDDWPGLVAAARRRFHERAAALSLAAGEQAHFLCLAEIAGCDFFGHLLNVVDAGGAMGEMSSVKTAEPASLALLEPGEPPLYVIAGRQIVSAEGLEILALGYAANYPDGAPAEQVVADLLPSGALVVLPWGVGKWLGRRGELVWHLAARFGHERRFFLGDNGNRPWCWPLPKVFAEFGPARNLPGSDPLRLPGQERRAACIGLYGECEIDGDSPFRSFKEAAVSGKLHPCGRPQNLPSFLHSQLALRLRCDR